MIRILRFLITGDWHLHQWDEYEKRDILTRSSFNPNETIVIGIRYVRVCRHCGKIKDFACTEQ